MEESCAEFPISRLRFAERKSDGRTTEPGENEFRVSSSGNACNTCGVGLEVVDLTFEAMPPIVLLHGFNSSAGAFARRAAREPGAGRGLYCEADPRNTNLELSTNDFITPLLSAGVPFDCFDAAVPATRRIEAGGGILAENIKAIAARFGRRFVHIIAHSKGGLWSRQALIELGHQSDPEKKIGVLSVISLDTPHNGSPLATLLVQNSNALLYEALRQVGGGGLVDRLIADAVADRIRTAEGHDDLTPERVAATSVRQEGSLRQIIGRDMSLAVRVGSRVERISYTTTYFNASADPDANNNTVLDGIEPVGLPVVFTESSPPPFPIVPTPAIAAFWNRTYQILRRFSSFGVNNGQFRFIANTGLPQNDVIVPVNSSAFWPSQANNLLQQIPGPRNFGGGVSGFNAHHMNIVSGEIAPVLLDQISRRYRVQ